MTIDVEDYFQVAAFSSVISRSQWPELPCRVESNVSKILDWLDEFDTKATFFVLAWIAERYPRMVREITERGHELASHGYGHDKVNQQSALQFKEDIVLAKKILESISGTRIVGYRAPSFSIDESTPWAHAILAEAEYRYSSSIYPIAHDHYGMPSAPRFQWRDPSGIVEIPATTFLAFGKNFPASGGGYFRMFPYTWSKWAITHINKADHQPVVFYTHPWEFDPQQPRVSNASLKSKFRHYVNLAKMDRKFRKLLADFNWGRVDQVYRIYDTHQST